MPYIRKEITLEHIKETEGAMFGNVVFYSVATLWWTHRQQDLRTHRDSGLPCDPRGGMLLQGALDEFIEAAEASPEHYGKHGLDTFIAAHNDNCVVSESDSRNTCLRTWQEYNDLIDAQAAAEREVAERKQPW